MNRFTALAAAAATTLAMSSAQALVVVVDDFSQPIPGVVIADNTGAGVSVVTANPSPTTTSRTVTHTLLTAGSFGANGSGNLSSAGTGALPNFAANQLNMSNGNGVDSHVMAEWSVKAVVGAGVGVPSAFGFSVVGNDLGTIGGVASPNTVEAFLNGVSLGTQNLSLGNMSFALSAAQAGLLTAASTFKLTFNGADAWDAAIDNLALTIPEPTTLALVGLTLLGLGAARRRKA